MNTYTIKYTIEKSHQDKFIDHLNKRCNYYNYQYEYTIDGNTINVKYIETNYSGLYQNQMNDLLDDVRLFTNNL